MYYKQIRAPNRVPVRLSAAILAVPAVPLGIGLVFNYLFIGVFVVLILSGIFVVHIRFLL